MGCQEPGETLVLPAPRNGKPVETRRRKVSCPPPARSGGSNDCQKELRPSRVPRDPSFRDHDVFDDDQADGNCQLSRSPRGREACLSLLWAPGLTTRPRGPLSGHPIQLARLCSPRYSCPRRVPVEGPNQALIDRFGFRRRAGGRRSGSWVPGGAMRLRKGGAPVKKFSTVTCEVVTT